MDRIAFVLVPALLGLVGFALGGFPTMLWCQLCYFAGGGLLFAFMPTPNMEEIEKSQKLLREAAEMIATQFREIQAAKAEIEAIRTRLRKLKTDTDWLGGSIDA